MTTHKAIREALLPCPFCGSSNVSHYEVDGQDIHSIECVECFSSSKPYKTAHEAFAAWNTRATHPAKCDGNPAAIRALLADLDAKTAELETERLRLVACGVVAMANTPESAKKAREMSPEYWSGSAQDVASAVDREMAMRDELQALRREPMTEEQIRSLCEEEWVFETVKQWVRIVEAFHGITQKEQGK